MHKVAWQECPPAWCKIAPAPLCNTEGASLMSPSLLLRACCVPDTVLGNGDTSEQIKDFCPHGAALLVGQTDNKQINIISSQLCTVLDGDKEMDKS